MRAYNYEYAGLGPCVSMKTTIICVDLLLLVTLTVAPLDTSKYLHIAVYGLLLYVWHCYSIGCESCDLKL